MIKLQKKDFGIQYFSKENWTSYTKLYLNIYKVSKLMQEIKKLLLISLCKAVTVVRNTF